MFEAVLQDIWLLNGLRTISPLFAHSGSKVGDVLCVYEESVVLIHPTACYRFTVVLTRFMSILIKLVLICRLSVTTSRIYQMNW